MINYDAALDLADYVRAIAITETNERLDVIGDGGQARGPFQLHPSTFKQYYGLSKRFPARTTDTWLEADIKACASFFDMEMTTWSSVDLVVQAWNLGVTAVLHGERNLLYLQRWTEALNRIRGERQS